jgi:phenylalanyl-tRNA synthetase beta chain
MPKIEVDAEDLRRLSGLEELTPSGLEERLAVMKGELDGWEDGRVKVELNDTNRPDLWCVEGVARALRCAESGPEPHLGDLPVPAGRLEVSPEMEGLRPYVAVFRARGWAPDERGLEALIATQEKLTESFGRSRSTAAIGFHRADLIEFPVRYAAVDPGSRMVPLGSGEEMTLAEVLQRTEKGRLYRSLLEGFDRYPALLDGSGEVFSFPPVLNSNVTGQVRAGDSDLFCDVTGTDWHTVQLTASILACNLEDRGAEVLPMEVAYPYRTPGGESAVCPAVYADSLEIPLAELERLLGAEVGEAAVIAALRRLDYAAADLRDGLLRGTLPPYRHDGIHPVDMVEDVAIGVGLDHFAPVLPGDYTVGRPAPEEELSDSVRVLLVGAGCEEILRPVLGSADRLSCGGRGAEPVRLANPMTLEYGAVRGSLLPGLLDVEAVSARAAYPHRLFEVGEVLWESGGEVSTSISVAVMVCGNRTDFGDAHSILGALCHGRGLDLVLKEADDGRFIPGRCARAVIGGEDAGMIGELHPAVLERWGVERPASAFEMDLKALGG